MGVADAMLTAGIYLAFFGVPLLIAAGAIGFISKFCPRLQAKIDTYIGK